MSMGGGGSHEVPLAIVIVILSGVYVHNVSVCVISSLLSKELRTNMHVGIRLTTTISKRTSCNRISVPW